MTTFPGMLGLSFDRRLSAWSTLEEKRFKGERLVAALSWKQQLQPDFPAVVCLVGGTGTGKSTLFNSLAGRNISAVGTRRPCTREVVVLVHQDWVDQFARCPLVAGGAETPNNPRSVKIATHQARDKARLILVDAPDFDSVELANRMSAENLFIISDILIFVTSQEKYGDLSGQLVRDEAGRWGKKTIVVMNKVASDAAFEHFRTSLDLSILGASGLIRVDRYPGLPDIISGLWERPDWSRLSEILNAGQAVRDIRGEETEKLRRQTIAGIDSLIDSLDSNLRRIRNVIDRIEVVLRRVESEMILDLDAVMSSDLRANIDERLQQLLRKYDIFFVPRMMVRTVVRKAILSLQDLLFSQEVQSSPADPEKEIRSEDMEVMRSVVRLKPLEAAVAKLNVEIADLLASDHALEDLRRVARSDVSRLDEQTVHDRFNALFPGVQRLLEVEFHHFRQGLTAADQAKLYGSYTIWALLMITAEIVLGGGFTLLDAMLNTAIFPFIPKWVLRLKILDLLKEIGGKVDNEYRQALRGILEEQGRLYIDEFASMMPDDEAVKHLQALKAELIRGPLAGGPS